MCPKTRRTGDLEAQTVDGHDVPKDQVVENDIAGQRLICRNEAQTKKPAPPNYWFSRKILCRDYKIRHCCKCTLGCHNNRTHDGYYKVDMPEITTLFDECEWGPFISNEAPPDYDGEDRAQAIKYGTGKQVCIKPARKERIRLFYLQRSSIMPDNSCCCCCCANI